MTQCKINYQRTKQVKNISFQSLMEDYFLFSAVKWKTLRKLVHLRLLPSTYINTSMHPLVFLSLNHFYNTINFLCQFCKCIVWVFIVCVSNACVQKPNKIMLCCQTYLLNVIFRNDFSQFHWHQQQRSKVYLERFGFILSLSPSLNQSIFINQNKK